MARKRTSSVRIVKVPARAAAPVIKVTAPRPAKVKHHRRSRRHGGGLQSTMIGGAVGGAAYGFIEKHYGDVIPTLPFIGRAGAVALGCYIAGRRGFGGTIVRDLGLAAAVIAGYQLGSLGHISGNVAPQVSGVAAQV